MSNQSDSGEGKAVQKVIGGMFVGAGAISIGVSIPLFRAAKKRKKERSKLINQYQMADYQ